LRSSLRDIALAELTTTSIACMAIAPFSSDTRALRWKSVPGRLVMNVGVFVQPEVGETDVTNITEKVDLPDVSKWHILTFSLCYFPLFLIDTLSGDALHSHIG